MFIDDNKESVQATHAFESANISYLKYHIKQFEENCCGEVPTTITPSVFAVEGVYKGLRGVKEYVSFRKKKGHDYDKIESESAYW